MGFKEEDKQTNRDKKKSKLTFVNICVMVLTVYERG